MDKWEREIISLRKTADKYNQKSYAAVACSVQLKWIFLQYLTNDTGQAFMGMERVLQENVLPCLFFGKFTPPPIL